MMINDFERMARCICVLLMSRTATELARVVAARIFAALSSAKLAWWFRRKLVFLCNGGSEEEEEEADSFSSSSSSSLFSWPMMSVMFSATAVPATSGAAAADHPFSSPFSLLFPLTFLPSVFYPQLFLDF